MAFGMRLRSNRELGAIPADGDIIATYAVPGEIGNYIVGVTGTRFGLQAGDPGQPAAAGEAAEVMLQFGNGDGAVEFG